jgi:hypothetical protein
VSYIEIQILAIGAVILCLGTGLGLVIAWLIP